MHRSIRAAAALAFVALAAPVAFAQDWTPYQSTQQGFGLLIPPGFVPDAQLGANGEQGFGLEAGTATLALSAGPSEVEITYTAYADTFEDFLVESGWTIEREEGADYVTLFGNAGGESFIRVRIEPRCGDRMMAFMLVYAAEAAAEIEPLIPELDAGLSEGDCSIVPPAPAE